MQPRADCVFHRRDNNNNNNWWWILRHCEEPPRLLERMFFKKTHEDDVCRKLGLQFVCCRKLGLQFVCGQQVWAPFFRQRIVLTGTVTPNCNFGCRGETNWKQWKVKAQTTTSMSKYFSSGDKHERELHFVATAERKTCLSRKKQMTEKRWSKVQWKGDGNVPDCVWTFFNAISSDALFQKAHQSDQWLSCNISSILLPCFIQVGCCHRTSTTPPLWSIKRVTGDAAKMREGTNNVMAQNCEQSLWGDKVHATHYVTEQNSFVHQWMLHCQQGFL